MRSAIKFIAISTNKPVGSPVSSFSIKPPCGSCVSALIPANSKTRLFTTTAWPSALSKTTGLSGENGSKSHLEGKRFSGQTFSIQPRPITHSPVPLDDK